MAISRVSSASASAASVTMPTHDTNDLLLIFTYRENSSTAPSLPGGWTSLGSNGGNTNSARVGYKIAASSSETSGTWTNATNIIVHVYRGVSVTNPVGALVAKSGSSTSVTYDGVDIINYGGTSWVAGFAGHKSIDTALQNAPTNMTNVVNLVDANGEVSSHDTNTAVTAWPATAVSVGGTASGWWSYTIEILDVSVVGVDTYAASTTYVAPAGAVYAQVKAWGSGGSGGGGGPTNGGSGGGGGAFATSLLGVSAGNSYTVTVGAAATGASVNTDGSDGSSSWFNTSGTILAAGGSKGIKDGGAAGAGGSTGACIGTEVHSGGSGGAGNSNNTGAGGGGAGGKGNGGAAGQASQASGFPTAGAGGSFGGGDGSAGGTNVDGGTGISNAATAPGGGSGGGGTAGTGSATGASGTGSVVVVSIASTTNSSAFFNIFK